MADNSEKPNDRPQAHISKGDDPDPEIYVMIDGQKFPKPGLETIFADVVETTGEKKDENAPGHAVGGVYCSCNKVCSCVPACSCVGHTRCSCHSHSSGGGYGCRCAPVH